MPYIAGGGQTQEVMAQHCEQNILASSGMSGVSQPKTGVFQKIAAGIIGAADWIGNKMDWLAKKVGGYGNVIKLATILVTSFGAALIAIKWSAIAEGIALVQKSLMALLMSPAGWKFLAIAAAKLGLGHVVAVDIDPIAVETTQKNAGLNQATLQAMTADAPLGGPFNMVMANILAQPLKVLAPALARLTADHGALVLSGILARQAEELLSHYGPLCAHLGPIHPVLRLPDGAAERA